MEGEKLLSPRCQRKLGGKKKRSIGKKLIKIPIKSIRNEHKIEGVLPILGDFGIFGFKGGFPSFGNKSEDSKSELAAGSE